MKTSSGIPRLDSSIISWWFKKTGWGREVCSTSSRRWGLSNLRMLGRNTAVFPESVGSNARTPLKPANRIWMADGVKSSSIVLATCAKKMHFKWVFVFNYGVALVQEFISDRAFWLCVGFSKSIDRFLPKETSYSQLLLSEVVINKIIIERSSSLFCQTCHVKFEVYLNSTNMTERSSRVSHKSRATN